MFSFYIKRTFVDTVVLSQNLNPDILVVQPTQN